MFDSVAASLPRQVQPDAGVKAAPTVAEGVTVIRSIITDLAGATLDDLPDQDLRRETVELARALASLQAQVFRRLAAVGGRAGSGQRRRPGGAAGDVAAWLRSQVGLAPAEAHRWVRTAESLYPPSSAPEPTTVGREVPDEAARAQRDHAPAGPTAPGRLRDTREALESGAITAGHAEVITRTLRRLEDALPREAKTGAGSRGDAESPRPDAEASGARVAVDSDAGAREQVLVEVESLLLDRARNTDVAELSRAATYARNTLDPEGARRDRRADEAERFLETSPTQAGGLRLRGYLTGASAASLQAALDSFSAPAPADEVTPDPRTATQRRADALGEISRRVLRAGEAGSIGGVRPQVQVLVPLPTPAVLRRPAGAAEAEDRGATDSLGTAHRGVTHQESAPPGTESAAARAGVAVAVTDNAAAPGGVTAFGQVLDQETIRQLACDAALTRLVVPEPPSGGRLADRGALIRLLTAPSRPLDVGRSERSVTPGMPIAVVARDRHCAFPGCDRPHTWCDAHHVRHWADGGATALDNLVLLCGRHHTAVHHDGWHVHIDPGTGLPTFTPPRKPSPPASSRPAPHQGPNRDGARSGPHPGPGLGLEGGLGTEGVPRGGSGSGGGGGPGTEGGAGPGTEGGGGSGSGGGGGPGTEGGAGPGTEGGSGSGTGTVPGGGPGTRSRNPDTRPNSEGPGPAHDPRVDPARLPGP